MVDFWTVQKSFVVDEVNKNGIYKPDFSKSSFVLENKAVFENDELESFYNYILSCFNSLNNTDCDGLIFSFAGYDFDDSSVFAFSGVEDFSDCMRRGYASIKSLWKKFEDGDYKLLHLRREMDFNPVTIDINDFQLLMPPVQVIPPYDEGYINFLNSNLKKGVVTRPLVPSGIMQQHLPDIRKQDIVEIISVPQITV